MSRWISTFDIDTNSYRPTLVLPDRREVRMEIYFYSKSVCEEFLTECVRG